jgi:hypothetical protein
VARRQAINPFYPLLVIAGVAFAVTAFAYGVMALKAISPADGDAKHPLLVFLDDHGMALMAVELGALAVTCFLAMGTDRFWSRRGADEKVDSASSDN